MASIGFDTQVAALSFLPVENLARVLAACKSFKASAEKAYRMHLKAQGKTALATLWVYRNFEMRTLRKIDANYTEILNKMPNVKNLDIDCLSAHDYAFQEGALEEILLSKNLEKLTTLSISVVLPEQYITDQHVKDIAAECRNLRTLSLHRTVNLHQTENNHLLTNKGMVHLTHLNRLQQISIQFGPKITDETLKIFEKMASLTSITMTHCNISKGGIRSLKQAGQARDLEFDDEDTSGPTS